MSSRRSASSATLPFISDESRTHQTQRTNSSIIAAGKSKFSFKAFKIVAVLLLLVFPLLQNFRALLFLHHHHLQNEDRYKEELMNLPILEDESSSSKLGNSLEDIDRANKAADPIHHSTVDKDVSLEEDDQQQKDVSLEEDAKKDGVENAAARIQVSRKDNDNIIITGKGDPQKDGEDDVLDSYAASLLTSNKLAQALAKTPFGADATSLIEVGCASDPFIKYFDWIDKRTCVAPYFVQYNGGSGSKNKELSGSHHEHAIESVVSDFMEYEIEDYSYDLLICSQVVEHVPDPSAFIKKLIRTAKTSIISVPYDWPDCGKKCGHLSHRITYEKLLEWTTPQKPIYSSIINEHRGSTGRRILLVFQQGE